MRDSKKYTLVSAGQVRAIVDSTNASPINVQITAHGFSTGDLVTINGHTTNTAANGTWTVTKVDANNITLDGSTGNGIGGATGCGAKAANVIFAQDFRNATITFDTDGGGDAAFTWKIVGSDGKTLTDDTEPDFAASQSVTNQYEFMGALDQEDGLPVDGDTGFVVATADDHRSFSLNIEGKRWISILATAGTAGELTSSIRLFDNQ